MENIRSYITLDLTLPYGKVLLSGNIGSGKSTILLAIDFALFGLQRTDLSGASLLRNGTDSGSVELYFEIEENKYLIKRTLKRTNSGVVQDAGYIIRNGIKEEKTAIELKQIILELLNYPKDLITKNKSLIYKYTVYTPQEEMKLILLGSKEERLDTLRKVFGVDKYKRIKENVKFLNTRLREIKKEYEGMINDLLIKISEKENKEKEKLILEQEITRIIPKIEETTAHLTQKKEEIVFVEVKKEELLGINKEIALLELGLKHKNNEKEQQEEIIKRLEKELLELEKENLELNEGYKEKIKLLEDKSIQKEKENLEVIRINKEIALLELGLKHKNNEKEQQEEIIKRLEKELLELEKENLELNEGYKEKIKLLEDKSNQKEKENREILNKIQELKTRKTHSTQIKIKMDSLNNCPTCYQEVSAEHKERIVNKCFEEVNLFDAGIKNEWEKNSLIENEIKLLREELDILRKKDSEINMIRMKIQQREQKKQEIILISNNIIKKNQEIAETKEKLLKNKKEEEKNSLIENEIKLLREELEILRKKDSEVNMIRMKIQQREQKRLDFNSKQQQVLNILLEINQIQAKLIEIKKLQQELNVIEEIYPKLKKELDEIQNNLNKLNIEKNGFDISKKHVGDLIIKLDEEIKNKLIIRDKKEQINKIQFWLTEKFVPMMDAMEKNILYSVHSEFNSLFERWFSVLIENNVLQMCLDEEYSPKIIQNGYDIDYEYLSGGEKTAGALAYRLALNQVINNLNTGIKTKDLLILDEPTDGFSSEQLERLKILMEEIKIPQIIIVSHEAQIESFVDHIIRFEKHNHQTRVY